MSGYEGPTGVGQLAVPVTDLERAVAFYRDVLGLRFLFRAPPGLAFLQCGEVRLMLSQPQPGEGETGAGVFIIASPIWMPPMRPCGSGVPDSWTSRIGSRGSRTTSSGWSS